MYVYIYICIYVYMYVYTSGDRNGSVDKDAVRPVEISVHGCVVEPVEGKGDEFAYLWKVCAMRIGSKSSAQLTHPKRHSRDPIAHSIWISNGDPL